MTTVTAVSIAEYLQTSYRPDREFVEGELRERNVGKWEHSRIQWLLALWFGQHEAEWGVIGSTEQRTRVGANRIRIPDLVILSDSFPPDVLVDPPLLVIEILSPDDRYSDTQERAQDYSRMGVQTIWLIDPQTRTGRMCLGRDWVEATRLEVPGTPLFVELGDLFARLDATRRPA